ncbi:DUF421 domain-containing protein [Methylobrevis pamukkalensis]|uniref:DUF421 domain-containing protein n=1 Tax=Methylobrevis pamukkalensis TaxID=1439726 RepID=A0A1E3H2R6_9HYPH|nr:YetF domain-containing protein [Methylobrevis pamukkalensis]ODN70106.1 hypothetical protein A6302_02585 [Methylobrevis pamukkalensis]
METVLRGFAVYLFLLLVIRLSGRRAMSEMTTFDFVLVLIIAETTQQALLGDDFSITNSFVLILSLLVIDVLFSQVKARSPRAAAWIDGVPTVLVSRGQPNWSAIRKARVGVDDILEAAREQQGLERLDQVKFAIIEVGGDISIVPWEQ